MQASTVNEQLNSCCMGASASSSTLVGSETMDQPSPCSSTENSTPNNSGLSSTEHFPNKMTSLGEVQRIIGLSLSKIQMGRNQRGGLPLHKNLLVATVLNKARDLYMQETMYMNYKMMTGQFAAAAAASNNNNAGHQPMGDMHHQQQYHHYGQNMSQNGMLNAANLNPNAHGEGDDDLEPHEANEVDYDEDSESDVEDECDVTSVTNASSMMGQAGLPMTSTSDDSSTPTSPIQYPPTTMASMLSLHMHMQQQQQLQQQQLQQQQEQQQEQVQEPPAVVQPPVPVSSSSDEGFIDEPDCDCDARNFSTSESRVPFQYCYNCAPFHPSNGRGPTLVPSPCPSPTPPSVPPTTPPLDPSETHATPSGSSNTETSHASKDEPNAVIYNMDSQSTEIDSGSNNRKRRRSSSDHSSEDSEAGEEAANKRRRESTETSPDSSRDESGYLSDSSQHEMFHPAFRGANLSTNSTNSEVPGSNPATSVAPNGQQQTMEIDQITSLVSIFSFGQHIMAAAAAANSCNNLETSTPTLNQTLTSQPSAGLEDEDTKKPTAEDSDSESDTSSDSGHSSDDHEAAKEEEMGSTKTDSSEMGPKESKMGPENGTKLTRSVSTPDLCAKSVVSSNTSVVASEAPPCVEVASL